MNMEYDAASTAVADDYEDDDVFQATPIAIEMKKLGHSLFGCCCDTRRGTIIVDIIMIVASIISLATEGFGIFALDTLNSSLAANNSTTGGSDGQFASSMNESKNDAKHAIQNSMVFSVFSIIFAILSIYGAAVFKIWPVAVNITFLFAHSIFYCVTAGAFFGFVIAVLWMYPQIMFVQEVHKGFMSSITYSREAQSCCCINKAKK
jgi:hypothetical protein